MCDGQQYDDILTICFRFGCFQQTKESWKRLRICHIPIVLWQFMKNRLCCVYIFWHIPSTCYAGSSNLFLYCTFWTFDYLLMCSVIMLWYLGCHQNITTSEVTSSIQTKRFQTHRAERTIRYRVFTRTVTFTKPYLPECIFLFKKTTILMKI